MPKGIYPRSLEMKTGKYKRTEKHLEILKQQAIYAGKHRTSSCGFQKGHPVFKNSFGHIPWNKGLKTGTRPQWVIDKISKARKGKPLHHSKQFKKGIYQGYGFKKGFIPWNKGKKGVQKSWIKGKHHSEITKEKIRLKARGRSSPLKGRKIPEEIRKKMSNNRKGIPSWKKGKHYLHLQRENSSNWRGGISNEPYSYFFNKELKEKIRKRDNYECQVCHITEEEHIIVIGEVLSIHHIDYDKKNYKEDNLVSLCRGCNARVNFNREYWKEYFQSWKLKLSITKQS